MAGQISIVAARYGAVVFCCFNSYWYLSSES